MNIRKDRGWGFLWGLRLSLFLICCSGHVGCGKQDQEKNKITLKSATKIFGREGYFRLAEIGKKWWFVSPDGAKLVSLGMNHVEPILLASENNRHIFEARYGKDLFLPNGRPSLQGKAALNWVRDSAKLLRSWGFNSLGVHNPVRQDILPYVAKFRPYPIDGWAGVNRQYPDPFSEETRFRVEAAAEQWCKLFRDDRKILGISFNDMTIWKQPKEGLHSWVRMIASLSAQSPGKIKWVEHLKARYAGNVAEASTVYGVDAHTWDDFRMTSRTAFTNPRRVAKDSKSFLPVIADEWYGILKASVRKCDPHHLVFGDKFSLPDDFPYWLDSIVAKHFDLSYLQWYDYADRQRPRLRRLYRKTQKPILMGDSSFSHPNVNLPRMKGKHPGSREKVGIAYANYLEATMKEPYVVGWHYCGFIEGSPDLAQYHSYFALQPGLLRPDGTPYAEIVAKVEQANANAFDWHEKARWRPLRARQRRAKKGHAQIVDGGMGKGNQAKPSSENTSTPRLGVLPMDTGGAHCRTTSETGLELTTIDDNVYVARYLGSTNTSVPQKNIAWVVTEKGVVVIDPGAKRWAKTVKQIIENSTKLPIKYIIYTHHHGTQVAGAPEFVGPETKIIAHEDLVKEFDLIRELHQHHALLNSIQFDLPRRKRAAPPHYLYPDITYATQYDFTLGKTKFELRHVVGESNDYSLVYLPEHKVVFTGDLSGRSVPLVASPMKPVRDEVKWKEALELVKRLEPEVVVGATSRPVCNRAAINAQLEAHIEYLDFVHRAVIAQLNRGATVVQALKDIKVPEHLENNPYLKEYYGCTEFNIRGLYHKYLGWFDRNGTHLVLVDPKIRAENFVESMGGRQAVLDKTSTLVDQGMFNIALEYLELLIQNNPADGDAKKLKSRILAAEAEWVRNPLKRNMLKGLSSKELE